MAEPLNDKLRKFFRFPHYADVCRAMLCYALFTLPIFPIAIFALSVRPENHNIRVILLIISVFLLIGSVCLFLRMFFGVLGALSGAVHELEIHQKKINDSESADIIINSISNLDQYSQTDQQQQYRLEVLQKQVNMSAYQSQINPHFLYNMLDAIRGQALEDNSVITSDMIEALSKMMRYAISDKGNMVTLAVELKSVDNYMKIQQFRFGNRFRYIKCLEEIDSGLIELKIPKMTLQPIVENAIVHGVESLLADGEIKLTIHNTQSRLVIQIADNGNGMDEGRLKEVRRRLLSSEIDLERLEGKGTGIALINVNARIKMTFGPQYGITLFSTRNVGTLVEITLPSGQEVR